MGSKLHFKSFAFGEKVPPASVDHVPPVALPPIEPPSAAVVPPWQIAAIAGPELADGIGVTTIVFDTDVVPQFPPDVVKISVAVPEYPAGGVHVAFKLVAFGLKVPPAVVDHIPPVALPPTEPPNAPDVHPWQIAAIAAPAFAVGPGFTVIFLFAEVVPQVPPLVFKVSVAVPEYPAGGVHVAFNVVAFGLKVPPAGVDHVPPVALPLTEPPSATVVPPWQIAAIAGPIFTNGAGLTVIVIVCDIPTQAPVVEVAVTV